MGKRIHSHTHKSLKSHDFLLDALAEKNKTHNIRARRTAVSGYDLSSSTLGLPEPQVITSYSSLPHWKDFEVSMLLYCS